MFDYSSYDANNEELCKHVQEIEMLLNSNMEAQYTFEKILELEIATPEKDFIGNIIEKVVPILMVIVVIITFFNWELGGKMIYQVLHHGDF